MMVGGFRQTQQSSEMIRNNTYVGDRDADRERVSKLVIERSENIEGQGTVVGYSSCFGRVTTNTRSFPGEGRTLSSCGCSGIISHGIRCKRSNAVSFAFGKGLSRQSLRNFSCISSGDVLPSVAKPLTNGAPNHMFNKQKLGVHNTKHRNAVRNGLRSSKSSTVGSARCVVHRNLQRGLGGLLSEKSSSNLSPAGSERAATPTFKASKWCLIRPTPIRSDIVVSNNRLDRVNSALQESNVGDSGSSRQISRTYRGPLESMPRAMILDGEMLSHKLGRNGNRGSGLSRRQSVAIEVDKRNTSRSSADSELSSTTPSFRHDGYDASSTIFFGSPSTSRTTPFPSLYGTSQRTQSLEAIPSPSSYMSSPDVQFANSGMLRSYASILQSPDLNRAVSSPECYEGHHIQRVETPGYSPFRQFPLRSFEENQVCFTFEGISEILSAREHVERDEISYEQVFMLEANLLLGGIASHDLHRDMRLDVDSMSYEELLALEERIGNVCTGLEKDAISRCLKSKEYSFSKRVANPLLPDSEVKCSICQEEFEEGVELGVLKCGHNHHFLCIEQWLLQKNQCPICKSSASS